MKEREYVKEEAISWMEYCEGEEEAIMAELLEESNEDLNSD